MAGSPQENRRQNVAHILGQMAQHVRRGQLVTLLRRLGVNQSTFSRLKAGKNLPSDPVTRSISRETGISFDDFSGMSPRAFSEKYRQISSSKAARDSSHLQARKLEFQSVGKSYDVLPECYAGHFGSYILVAEQSGDAVNYNIVVGLLNIYALGESGIEFKLFLRAGLSSEVWTVYDGLMFEVGSFLHFVGEDVPACELIFFITTRLRTQQRWESVEGYLLGVRRSGRTHRPMSWKLTLFYYDARAVAPQSLDQILGAFGSRDQLPRQIRDAFGKLADLGNARIK